MKQLPTYIDRYPAKMVTRLADVLIEKYAKDCSHLFDPFCGSGAVLSTGKSRGLKVSGVDINPYAVLLSNVKLSGYERKEASKICYEWIRRAKKTLNRFPVKWKHADYWFTKSTLNKYERLRYEAKEMCLSETREGRAALLAFALSVRRCSRADQRSPKPFISKTAIMKRKGKHFSPFKDIEFLLNKLSDLYGTLSQTYSEVSILDIVNADKQQTRENVFSHAITSPPYINAQDYFRNFKLELFLLEDLLPFKVDNLREKFVGTERGNLLFGISESERKLYNEFFPNLSKIEETHPKSAAIIQRYLSDMSRSFDIVKSSLVCNGIFVIVCGDNLVSGYSVPTWEILNQILETKGFSLFDEFGDKINRRALAPKRNSHRGLIKEERVSAFKLNK